MCKTAREPVQNSCQLSKDIARNIEILKVQRFPICPLMLLDKKQDITQPTLQQYGLGWPTYFSLGTLETALYYALDTMYGNILQKNYLERAVERLKLCP